MAAWLAPTANAAPPGGLIQGEAPVEFSDDPTLDDAALADVHFSDELHGWAVGDRGAIWHTADGGQHWLRQSSGMTAPLADVHFIDASTGWAVGGEHPAFTPLSTAAFLTTRDGGHTWQAQQNLSLPALRRVGATPDRQPWAVGDGSAMHASGLFAASGRGRNWTTLPGTFRPGWSAGQLTSPVDGMLVDHAGLLWQLSELELHPAEALPASARRRLRQLAVASAELAWAAGDRGVALCSRDGGRSWQPPFGPLPHGCEGYNWRAVAAHGRFCCLAGEPGDRVLLTKDAGQTWEWGQTGQALPLYAVAFPTPDAGWAVGSLGVMLHSSDGGRTWAAQRGKSRRAAALVICPSVERLPLEVVARLAGEDGYRVVVEVLSTDMPTSGELAISETASSEPASGELASGGRQPPVSAAPYHREARIREALIELGAADVHFAAEVIEPAAFAHHVRRAVNTWRPEIVIAAAGDAAQPGSAALADAVVQVCRDSAPSGDAIAASRTDWRVRRVWFARPNDADAYVVLHANQLAPHAGLTLGDAAAAARRRMHGAAAGARIDWGLRAALGRSAGDVSRRDLFSQIHLPHDGDARRARQELVGDGSQLRHAALRNRQVAALLNRAARAADPRTEAGLAELVAPLARDEAATALLDFVLAAEAAGNWTLAAEACQLLADRTPRQPLGEWAAVWLLRYWSSEELAWRLRGREGAWVTGGTQTVGGAMAHRIPAAGDGVAVQAGGGVDDFAPLAPAQLAAFDQNLQQRLAQAADWLRRVERDYPARAAEPDVRPLPLADSTPAYSVVATTDAPTLDGRLDDPCWQRASVQTLAASATLDDAVTEWRMAADDRFLYVCVRVPRAASLEYEAAPAQRRRDVEVTSLDRVTWSFDTDADGALGYRFTVASDGTVCDALGRDAAFDPRWFVASQIDASHWTLEAAIPWVQLAPTRLIPSAAAEAPEWRCSLARHVPGRLPQCWPAAADEPAEAVGRLTVAR